MSDKPASRRDLYALIMRAYAEAGIKPGAESPFLDTPAGGARWVMDLGWYRAVRAAAGMPETPGEPQVPSPADMLFGMPVLFSRIVMPARWPQDAVR